MLLVTMLLTLLVISGCGSNAEETNADEKASTSEEKKAEVDEQEKEEEPKEEAGEAASAGNNAGDFAELITYMEEETEGTAKILYENKEPQVHKMDGVTVSLDAYTLLELNDFHTDFSIPFDDGTNGGVILAQYTVTNELDKDVYYMPAFYLSYTGAQKDRNNYRELLPLEKQLVEKLSPSNDYLLKPGETVTGYYTYPFGQDALQAVLDVSTAMVEVPSAQAVKGDFGSPIGKNGQFTLSLNEAGAEISSDGNCVSRPSCLRGDLVDRRAEVVVGALGVLGPGGARGTPRSTSRACRGRRSAAPCSSAPRRAPSPAPASSRIGDSSSSLSAAGGGVQRVMSHPIGMKTKPSRRTRARPASPPARSSPGPSRPAAAAPASPRRRAGTSAAAAPSS